MHKLFLEISLDRQCLPLPRRFIVAYGIFIVVARTIFESITYEKLVLGKPI